jgi:hypothetical protein
MESTLDIRKKIHEFIDKADERILKIFNGIINAEEVEEAIPTIPEFFYEELDKRKERRIKGESKASSWEEVKNRILTRSEK